MADIKQAAKWMSEGRRVRRASMLEWIVTSMSGMFAPIVRARQDDIAAFDPSDLLADDWEIAEQ